MLRPFACALVVTSVLVAPVLADEVILEKGDILHGKIAEKTEVKIILDHPIFGRVDIPMAAVKSVRFDAQIAADERMEGGIEEAAAAVVEEQAKVEKEEWKSRFELGFSGSNGNTRSKSWHVAFDTRKEDEKGLWKADARWDTSESYGVETKNRFTSGVRRDWNMGDSPWVIFAEARYDRDRFTEWDQRASLSAGFGYQFVKTESTTVKGRAGVAATKEWGSAEDDHVRPEGLLGVDFSHQLTSRQFLEASTTYYPDFADTPEYRLVSTAGWTIRLDDGGGVSLKFGVAHELDTHRQDPFKRQDLTYFGVLVFDF